MGNSYRVGPLSRLVGGSSFEPSLSKGVLRLIVAANDPNGAISLTKTFNHILLYVCNGRCFGIQKAKKRGSGNNRVYRSLKAVVYHSMKFHLRVGRFGGCSCSKGGIRCISRSSGALLF